MSEKPVLLFDAGNTNIKFGLADADRLHQTYAFPTSHFATSDEIGFKVLEVLRLEGIDPRSLDAWAVSSVVPRINPLLRYAARRFSGCPVMFAPGEIQLDLENRYERPTEVGADRLVTAFGATRLYNAPAYIVIDFGTATTFDCVVGNAYLGGLICPGILSSAGALAGGTAKLPQVDLVVDSHRIQVGRSTRESMNQGLVFGFAGMVEGLCARLKEQLPEGTKVVVTGGLGKKILRVTNAIDFVQPDLLLEGLRLAYYESLVVR